MSAMEQTTSELQSHLESQSVPPPPQDVDFHLLATQKVSQVPGLDPSQAQLAILLAQLQIKAEHEAKLARHLLEKSLMTTINTVNTHARNIASLDQSVNVLQSNQADLQKHQSGIFDQLHQIQNLAWQSYKIAVETKQKGSKGNLVVQGEHIPPYSPNEDLYTKVFPIIHQKYGIQVNHNELKSLHRLPNGKVFFTLSNILPGQTFDKFTKIMNSNPNPQIKVFVSIQLFEPYAELYYIARRLKHYQVISNYRLDENGNTQIALSPTTQSFKFTGLEQLQSLQVNIPQQINDEINFRRSQIKQNEEKTQNLNNEKSKKLRPTPPTGTSQSVPRYIGPPPPRPPLPLTGSNTVPILPRVPAPAHPTQNPVPNHNFQYQNPASQKTPSTIRTKSIKRPNSSPAEVTDLSIVSHPPPNQCQSPPMSYYSYPQSYWTTPPPGEEPPPHAAGLTGMGMRTRYAGQSTSTSAAPPPAGLRGYEDSSGQNQVWPYKSQQHFFNRTQHQNGFSSFQQN